MAHLWSNRVHRCILDNIFHVFSVEAFIWISTVEFRWSQSHSFAMCVMATNQERVLKTIFTLIEMNNDKIIHINAYMCARYEFSIAKHLYVSHCLIWLKCGLNAISLFMPFKMRWISIYLYLTYVRTDKWRWWWRRCEWKRICTCSRIRTQSIHFSFKNNPIERPIVFGP